MEQVRIPTPSTPTRRTASSSRLQQLGDLQYPPDLKGGSQSTPIACATDAPPRPSNSEESSFNTSSSADGSIVLHSISDPASGSGLDSSFEALHLGHAPHSSTDSSLEIIVHSSPATTGFLAFSLPEGVHTSAEGSSPTGERSAIGGGGGGGGQAREARHSRHSSLVAIDEKRELALLNPVARAFDPVPSNASTLTAFRAIIVSGKDDWGQLTAQAKAALARLGLKPVPSLHGPLNLPYARCASGIDAFIESDNPDGEPWGDDEHEEGGAPTRPSRTLPIPLPGNSRYTQAGRLAMRYSSAPATLESGGGKRSSRPTSSPRRPPAPPAASTSKSKNLASPAPPPPISTKNGGNEGKPSISRPLQPSNVQSPPSAPAQPAMDAHAFARAQAMQAFFLQQAQLAQVIGGQAANELLAAQQGAGTGNFTTINAQSPPASNFGYSRAQSPFLPPFQPFSPPTTYASPPIPSQPLPNYVDYSPQVDSLTLLKLAGQRQLGLNSLPFPFPQVNLPQQMPTTPLFPQYSTSNVQDSDVLGGRQAEGPSDDEENDYDRAAVPHTTVRKTSSGGNGYDFLREGTSQGRRGGGGGGAAANRRNSAVPRFEAQGGPPPTAKAPHETRRRRSAAPAMPYPGHSLRKGSTSSIVTVNSNLHGPVPQVRIFSDPSSPPTASASSQHRRRSTSTGRPLEDLANSQRLSSSSSSSDQKPRASPAETSTNWRRPSLPDDEPRSVEQVSVTSPTPPIEPTSSHVEGQPSRGRGKGGRGRRRGGGRGTSKSRGQNASTTNNA